MKARICLTGLLFFLCTCDGLFGSFTRTNPENCVENPGICASTQRCDLELELCVANDPINNPQQLALNAVLPPQGPVNGGNQVTIDGQGFAAGIIVTFDGMPATQVTVVSSMRLMVTAPASRTGQPGSVVVEVAYAGGPSARWNGLYMYGGALPNGPINFMTAPTFGISLNVPSLLVADFDKDGKTDVGTMFNANVLITRGDGTGLFGAAMSFPQGAATTSGIVADINGDQAPDIVTIDTGNRRLIAMINGAMAQNFSATSYLNNSASNMGNATFGDFDGDGDLDVAVIDKASTSIHIFPNQGSGVFGTPMGAQVVTVNAAPLHIVAAQYTLGDSNLDLIVAHNGTGMVPNVGVLRGLGNGGFMGEVLIGTSSNVATPQPSSIAVQDFDLDGKMDVMVLNTAASSVAFLYGDGGTNVRMVREFNTGAATPISAIAGDFNGDSIFDIVVGSTTSNIYTLRGLGGGNLEQPASMTATGLSRIQALAVANYNSDMKPDLVLLDDNQSKIQVLLNISM